MLRKILSDLEGLEHELMNLIVKINNITFVADSSSYDIKFNSYSALPSLNLEEKILGAEDMKGKEDEGKEKINPYLLVYQPHRPDYFGWIINRVPRSHMGYGVLGRAFPYKGLIEIASDLYGNDFEEVRTHEILHMQHPEKSEADIRMLTRISLPFTPRWH